MSISTLILGGARSGKSSHAEALADAWPGRRVYIATAQAGDEEMAQRIEAHRKRRGWQWSTIEAPLHLVSALQDADSTDCFILIDCVTLWISNLMLADTGVGAEIERLANELPRLDARIVLVSNEVGLGIVPDNALARRFRDVAGWANQRLAQAADEVLFIAAGLPLVLKRLERAQA